MNNIQKYGTYFDSKLEKTQLCGLFMVYGIYEYIIDESYKVSYEESHKESYKDSHDLMQYGLEEYDVD